MHNERGHRLSPLGDIVGVSTEMCHKTSALYRSFKGSGEKGSDYELRESDLKLYYLAESQLRQFINCHVN